MKRLCGDGFPKNAFNLFNKAIKIVSDKTLEAASSLSEEDLEKAKQILDHMLHSILFLGNIQATCYLPKYIFSDVEMLNRTMNDFPDAFHHYQTYVARRTPFSYFVELVTVCYRQENVMIPTVILILSELLSNCKKSGDLYPLISTVICICETDNLNYYGVSLSCESDREREIMTAVSCLHVWHPKVSSAVMSVFPEGTGNPRSIKLPDKVSCRAYAVEDMSQVKPPCRRCHELYSLPGPSENLNDPGNCAETEAISNLLHCQKGVDDKTTIAVGVYNDQEIRGKMTTCFNENMNKINMKKSKGNHINYNILTVYN
ncbi:uncharacterized protein LOC131362368 isoform X2 [Hemibagrus wyckioides]|nr:uncharacterized protein LOC131362368 isoform X2 [Hemibagrus wyckioides]